MGSITTLLSSPQGPSLEQTSLPIVNSVGPLMLNYLPVSSRPNLQVFVAPVAPAKARGAGARHYAARARAVTTLMTRAVEAGSRRGRALDVAPDEPDEPVSITLT